MPTKRCRMFASKNTTQSIKKKTKRLCLHVAVQLPSNFSLMTKEKLTMSKPASVARVINAQNQKAT